MPVKTISLIAFSTLAFATAASADEVKFSFSASELQSVSGAETVYARMERRAESLCNTAAARRALYPKSAIEACESRLIEDWVSESGDARLRQIHAASAAQQLASAK